MVDAPTAPRRVSLLGATGSIGANTADLLRRNLDRFAVEAVTASRDVSGLARVARELDAKIAVVADPSAHAELKAALAGSGIAAAAGPAALIEAAQRPVDLTVAAIVGAAGLAPTLAAIEAGSSIALANKECLVSAGHLFMAAARRKGVQLLPADSEHNAIFQALGSDGTSAVDKIILTASGGPFRDWPEAKLATATPEQAAAHPNWSMGKKVSVDSSTLINKGLELIEAHHLFGVEAGRLDVLIHPQSIVHGLVAYRDGSVLAQLSITDMRVPLAYCLWWPERRSAPAKRLDLAAIGSLSFRAPDPRRFPGLGLARRALEAGGSATNILNAANEIAVMAFLEGRIGYLDIVSVSEETLASAGALGFPQTPTTLAEVLVVDAEARRLAESGVAARTGAHQKTRIG